MIFKPMLSGTLLDVQAVRYPALFSPKLDGIRAMVQDGVLVSRNLKPIRNAHAQKLFGRPEYEGLDGELVVGPPHGADVFLRTSSGVMSAAGTPDVKFYVFDKHDMCAFEERLQLVKETIGRNANFVLVPHIRVHNAKELLAAETRWLDEGFEGGMLRHPDGPYKEGRSTEREGYLLKLKTFEYDKAEILQLHEAMENTNTDVKDALGHAKRSTAKAGLKPKGTLGGMTVRMLEGPFAGKTTHCGPGKLTAKEREAIWTHRDSWRPTIVVKYFLRGSKDLPRFPLFDKIATDGDSE